MKILQINAVWQSGSTGRTCAEMSDYLWSIGHECYTACSAGAKLNENNIYKVTGKFECKIHAFFSRISGHQGYFSPISTKRLINFIEKIQPDVVLIRNIHANFINQNILFSFLSEKKIPTILALDDCWFFTGGCTHYTVSNCDRWKIGCGKCKVIKKEGIAWFFDRTSQVCKDRERWYKSLPKLGVVGVSNWITEEAKKSYVFQSVKNFRCVYNWIDTDCFKIKCVDELRNALGVCNKRIILGVAGFWNEKKGFGEFLRLAEKLSDEYQIILVGNHPDEYFSNDRIRFVGAIDSLEELASYYNLANVFVTFSQEESFGKVSAEALCCGTPVVCYSSTANGEIVGVGCGEVIEPGDFETMVDSICRIANTDKSIYSAHCHSYASEKFSKHICIKNYLDFFENIVNVNP